MEELIKRCKCGVFLSVNEYRDYCDTIETAIGEKRRAGHEQIIGAELAARMIKEGCLYELQFYPTTPVGFCVVYGTSLDEVVKKALETFD